MTSVEILAMTRPEQLFPGDPDAARARYLELVKEWHPDRGGSAPVFAHVHELYQKALYLIRQGQFGGASIVRVTTMGGREFTFQSRTTSPFALGHTIVCDDRIAFLVDPLKARGVQWSAVSQIPLTYAGNRMREEFARYLPSVAYAYETHDSRHLIGVPKTSDQLRLQDVLTHTGGLDPKHVAWIVSSLLNLCCYLAYANLVHHDISPDTVYISPPHHSAALLGGWWYYRKTGTPMGPIPARTATVVPYSVRRDKLASPLTDIELVKLTALECLAGTKAPDGIQKWLETPSSASPVSQYQAWVTVRDAAFGRRRFTPMLLDADTVYGNGVMVN